MKNTRKLMKPMATHTKQQILLLLALILLPEKASSQPKPGCPGNCGSLSIPYPFGTTKDCSLDESFLINCTQTNSTAAPTPFLAENNTILNITLDGELKISSTVSQVCSPYQDSVFSSSSLNLSNFLISSRRNMFTTIGCATLGMIEGQDSQGRNHITTCFSFCNTLDEISAYSSCSGTGCCQSSIHPGLSSVSYLSINVTINVTNQSEVLKTHPCGYAFLVEEDAYNFSSVDVRSFRYQSLPVVVDWAVGNQTCQDAQNELSSYACKAEHSECHNSTNGIGYLCKCSSGYQGNPYLPHGCYDIDECLQSNLCVDSCSNLPGSYKCSCLEGYEGDGLKNGTGCQPKSNSTRVRVLAIALGISLGLLALLVGSFYIYFGLKKRTLVKLREKCFIQNGGMLLQQKISRYQGLSETTKIFTAQELKIASNNYDHKRILGQGGNGTVYKGILADNKVVAIKKSKISDQSQVEQFINEVIILSQINHRNVVKLLGCCLETEVPLLVYEFISNGTLFDHIHDQSKSLKLSWDIRLKIATEIAGVLAYLHSATSMPIIHRDMKTTNILLDHNLIAKVSDFGASKLVPLDQTQLTTLVQGTLGYLDPEYFQTSQLTEKSDVYSFGVVLAELLTSEKALSFVRSETDRNLSMYFVSSMKKGQLVQILDNHMISDTNVEQIMKVANLVKMCLSLKGEDRPSMKEVATELEGLRIMESMRHPWQEVDMSTEESEILVKVNVTNGRDTTSGFDSIRNQNMKSLGDG